MAVPLRLSALVAQDEAQTPSEESLVTATTDLAIARQRLLILVPPDTMSLRQISLILFTNPS